MQWWSPLIPWLRVKMVRLARCGGDGCLNEKEERDVAFDPMCHPLSKVNAPPASQYQKRKKVKHKPQRRVLAIRNAV